MSEGLNSRLCALQTLNAVFDNCQTLENALDKYASKLNLSPQDKGFTHALCGFVLRYKPSLQDVIQTAGNRKKPFYPAALNTLLLIGAAQIYLMDVPDHAAVNSAVDLAVKIKCSKQKAMINAILRRLIREGEKDLKPTLPNWLVKKWEDDYGLKTAKALEQASIKQAETGLTFRYCEEVITDEAIHKTSPSHGLLRYARNDAITNVHGYEEGQWWVQDYASHYPVFLLPDLTGKIVFDLCAAPGGKTMQLAAKGATVKAVDISEKRLSRLRENVERTQLSEKVVIICADILKWKPQQKADIVLLDAPCSATGTLRRHPDLPYIRGENDVAALIRLQVQLLDKVKHWLKEDGLLIYCTCSLQKDEGERQIENFLQQNPAFSRDKTMMIDAQFLTKDGDARLLPTYGSMDGFFISYLRFKSSSFDKTP